MSKTSAEAVVTIVANNYLAYALTLCESIKRDNVDKYIVLVDGFSEKIDYSQWDYNFISASELPIPRFEEMSYKYNVVEFSTSIKPFALGHLLNEFNYQHVFYVDPDIMFFDSFENVLKEQADHAIMITPHITRFEQSDDNHTYEKGCLRFGIYNLGFIGITNCDESQRFLSWWQDRVTDYCYMDETFYTDQKWINLAPIYFEDVYINKNKTFNFAEWNFCERVLEEKDGSFEVEGKKLVFFHFSGYKAGEPVEFLEKRKKAMGNNSFNTLIKIYTVYHDWLQKFNYKDISDIEYKYNYYSNGVAIDDIQRSIYRNMLAIGIKYDALFSVEAGTLYDLYVKKKIIEKAKPGKISAVTKNMDDTSKQNVILKANMVMRLFKKIVGIRRFEKFMRYTDYYCKDYQQYFLIDKEYCQAPKFK